MEEQELKHIWNSSSKKEDITINTTQLINNFKQNMEHRERIVRRRDRREIIVAIIGIGIYGYIALRLPLSISSIAAIFVAISLGYIIYKLRSQRKSKYEQDLFLPLTEQLKNQKQFMLSQVKLLESVLYWYFLPFFISYMVYIWGAVNMDAYNDGIVGLLLVTRLKSKIIVTLLMIALGIYIVRTNKRAAKINWKPLIKKIDTILDNLKEEEK